LAYSLRLSRSQAEGLLTQPGLLFVGEFGRVLALAGTRLGGAAGGVVTVGSVQVVGQLGGAGDLAGELVTVAGVLGRGHGVGLRLDDVAAFPFRLAQQHRLQRA
jgi:hypothetical protein